MNIHLSYRDGETAADFVERARVTLTGYDFLEREGSPSKKQNYSLRTYTHIDGNGNVDEVIRMRIFDENHKLSSDSDVILSFSNCSDDLVSKIKQSFGDSD